MLTPRNAILAAVLLFATYVVSSVLDSRTDLETRGTAADSFGVGRPGYRALADVLVQLGIPVERRIAPPVDDPPATATVLLLEPQSLIVRTEPQPLRRLSEWVQRGGRLVIAPDFPDDQEQAQLETLAREHEHFNAELLATLGLPGVRVELLLSGDVPTESPDDDEELVISRVANSSTGPAAADLRELVTWGEALPEVLWDDETTPSWQTRILDADQDERVLAAGFSHGAGEIVVVSDATLCSNVALARGQNALWLVSLLTSGDRKPVIFDEFYHGLSVRGNAWWLLTRPALAGLAVCGLIGLVIWTWRGGVLLGLALTERTPSRRSIGEYVAAMSRFFLRGRDAERFVLRELRDGVRRRLNHEVGLSPGNIDIDRLVERFARRDPSRAARIREAFQAGDDVLTASLGGNQRENLKALRDLSALTAATSHHSG